jgi:hypothetical protein
LRACVNSTNPALQGWAGRLYERYRDRSCLLTADTIGPRARLRDVGWQSPFFTVARIHGVDSDIRSEVTAEGRTDRSIDRPTSPRRRPGSRDRNDSQRFPNT